MNTAAIARRLEVAPKTVSNHVSNILVKLQVADRTQAAVLARDSGLGRPQPRIAQVDVDGTPGQRGPEPS